jgi:GT2 family glycosyltransferase
MLRIVNADARPGLPYALNVGVEAARGRALIFIGHDDEVAPGFVAAMGEALREHDVVAPRIDMESLNDDALLAWRPKGFLQDGQLNDDNGFLPHVTGTGLGMTRRSLDAIGSFDPDMSGSEDVDMSWRLQLSGFTIQLEPRAVLRYRYRTEATALYRQARGYGLGQAALYHKHRSNGMPKRNVRDALRDWLQLLIQIPRNPTRANWYFWLYSLGYRVGRLKGSIRYRVFYL